MIEQVELFLAILLGAGFGGEQACEKAYEYALHLLAEQEVRGAKVTAAHMTRAAELVRDAQAGAWKLHNERRSVPPVAGEARPAKRKGKASAIDTTDAPDAAR